jgi:UV DNA damage endonuclease
MAETLGRILATWPAGETPKIHYSSPRTEMRQVKRREEGTKRTKTVHLPPVMTGHADFTNPFEFARFMRDCAAFKFDVMLEAKAKDVSLRKLRTDLLRYAPDVAARFGLSTEGQESLAADEAIVALDELGGEGV